MPSRGESEGDTFVGMRRAWERRTGAALLVLWAAASVAERAVLDHCPQHDPLAAAVSAHGLTMRGTRGVGTGPRMRGIGVGAWMQCAAATAMALPAAPVHGWDTTIAVAERQSIAGRAIAPRRVGVKLPYSNGPPHALSA